MRVQNIENVALPWPGEVPHSRLALLLVMTYLKGEVLCTNACAPCAVYGTCLVLHCAVHILACTRLAAILNACLSGGLSLAEMKLMSLMPQGHYALL